MRQISRELEKEGRKANLPCNKYIHINKKLSFSVERY